MTPPLLLLLATGWKRRATGTETVLNFPGGTTTTATANGGFGNNIEYELGSNVWMSTSPCSASFKEDLDAWISGTQARLNTMEKIIDSGLYHPQSDRSLLSGVYGSSTNPNNYTKAEFPPSGDSRFTNVKCNGCVEIWQDE